jgi:RNA polymerase sigma-70 factor (ECF subfamily)
MDLGRALDKLGRTDRSALYLHFYCDMTFEQVATVLGISMTAARSRIYRALDRLRRFLAPQGEFANGW